MLVTIENSRLHVLSCQPPPIPFLFLCMGNSRFTSVSTGRNGTKTSAFLDSIPLWLTKQLNMNFLNAITALLAVVSKRVQIIEV